MLYMQSPCYQVATMEAVGGLGTSGVYFLLS